MKKTSTGSTPNPSEKKYSTENLQQAHRLEDPALDRQRRVPGFHQDNLTNAEILLVGAGGIGGEVGEGLARKGTGKIKIFDHDTVETSNLNRQLFYPEDRYKNKAIRLAKNLARESTGQAEITGHPTRFQEAVAKNLDTTADIVICGVDNDKTREYVSKHYHKTTPVIIIGIGRHGNSCYLFIQEPHGPCFRCLTPNTKNRSPCPKTPAVKDPLKLVAGLTLYAVDTLLMDRERNWNYRKLYLHGIIPDEKTTVHRKNNCPQCGGENQ